MNARKMKIFGLETMVKKAKKKKTKEKRNRKEEYLAVSGRARFQTRT
jgi:hypothetical protein